MASAWARKKQEADAAGLLASTTLYVGNLSFYTTEEQVFELFSKWVGAAHLPACGRSVMYLPHTRWRVAVLRVGIARLLHCNLCLRFCGVVVLVRLCDSGACWSSGVCGVGVCVYAGRVCNGASVYASVGM